MRTVLMRIRRRVERWIRAHLEALARGIAVPYDIPPEVRMGRDVMILHGGVGIVINKRTTIGDRVRLYHGVTVGRADASIVSFDESPFERIDIEDDVVLYPGVVVLGGAGVTVIGRGTIVGANSVLMTSTGPNEVWAGNPARLVKKRHPAV